MIGGLAGDMFLAAAIGAGLVDAQEIASSLSLVGLGQIQVTATDVRRYGIAAKHVSFSGWGPEHEADHRHLSEIERMISSSALPEPVKAQAISLFRVLGESESQIHDIPLERVHFHEIGAVDSILDFVAAAIIIDKLQATWSIDHVPAGRGVIKTEHGVVPATAPATARLLQGFTLTPRDVEAELVTPTGAAILCALKPATQAPTGKLLADGYGAGTKDFKHMANVVRFSVFELADEQPSTLIQEPVVRLVAELDDMTPQALAFVAQELMTQGALDVVRTAVTMKKGRLGTQLAVLAHPQDQAKLAQAILTQTSTLGVRVEPTTRYILERRIVEVHTVYGPLHAKLAIKDGRPFKGAPEFDQCAQAARAHDVPISRVLEAAQLAIEAILKEP